MKKLSTYLIIILSIVIIILIIKKPKPEIIFNDNTDKFKNEIKELKLSQFSIDSTIIVLNDSINSLNSIISKYESEIKTLKQKRNEKLSVVNKYTNDELYEFLSKRYQKDSIR